MTTGHIPRPRYDICDWQDWSRPRHALVRRTLYRRADNGNPVEVLVPTWRGRLAMWWRAWSQV